MTPITFYTPPARLLGVLDLRARHGADVGALAVQLVQLEAAGTLLVGPPGRVVDAVPRVGADEDGLPNDVVRSLAVRAEAEGRGEFGAGGGAEESGLGTSC